jgi:1-phosphofructokinase
VCGEVLNPKRSADFSRCATLKVGAACAVVDEQRSEPRVAILGPDPLLSITIEARGSADDIHLHAAGQGVWAARMAAELGAYPVLCGFVGGETGVVLAPLLEAIPGEVRLVETASASGSYVSDRRRGERRLLASSLREAPRRHESDDLIAATCAAALGCELLVVCNPFPPDGLPGEVYDTVVSNVRAAGVPVIVDLSSPRLEHAVPHRPNLVKLNDWELAEYVCGPVDGPRALDGARRLIKAGAGAVAVTRAEAPILVVPADEEPYEVVPPPFPSGHREGCGDAMTGAVAAASARGLGLRQALVLGAAAGAGNFLRHGLGTGRRAAIEELAERVSTRPLETDASPSSSPPASRTAA